MRYLREKIRLAKKSLRQLIIFELLASNLYLGLYFMQYLPESLLEWQLKLAVTSIAAICITLILTIGALSIWEARARLKQAKADLKSRIEWEKYLQTPRGFYEAFWNEPYPEG